jgi:PQQ-dependent catabolism-associated CXXCW motif protein
MNITPASFRSLRGLAGVALAGAIGLGACIGPAMAQGAPGLRNADGMNLPPLPGTGNRGQAPGAGNAGQAPGMGNPGYAPGMGHNAPRGAGAATAPDALMAWERQDMGVPLSRELHGGPFHGPTPNRIPGGQLITTAGLLPLLQQGIPVRVFDVLGGPQALPNAIPAAWAARPGSFDDETQAQLQQLLRQATRGRDDVPLVFYCGGPQCWMSYNAALRAIQLGYRNVLWYRGGLEAWQRSGQPLVGAQQQTARSW